MSDPRVRGILLPLIDAVRQAGAVAAGLFYGPKSSLHVGVKGDGSYVCSADTMVEQFLIKRLHELIPNGSVLSEEAGYVQGADATYTWVIDPIDGTTNVVHGIPHFAVCVALVHAAEVVAAVVYDPTKDELFYATDDGAYLSSAHGSKQVLAVSDADSATERLLIALSPADPLRGSGNCGSVWDRCAVRWMGCVALDFAYLAAGRIDGIVCSRPLKWWDIAAGALLVKRAGGVVSDLKGAPLYGVASPCVGGNRHVWQMVCDILRATA